MAWILNHPCDNCGGKVAVLPFTEVDPNGTGRREIIVGDAGCIECLHPVILPGENYKAFVTEHCHREAVIL